MLTAEQVESFQAEGYLMGPQVYSDAEADQLLERMFEILEGKRQGAESSRNMRHRVDVELGEVLQGSHFPTVWENGPLKPVAA